MTKRNRIWLPLLLVLLLLLSACVPAANSPANSSPTPSAAETPAESPSVTPVESPVEEAPAKPFATLSDRLGREVVLAKQPEAIVTLTPANTEIVCALGLSDKLVAVDDYSNYPQEVSDLPRIGAYAEPNIEAIVALNPDLVLAGDALQQEAIDQLAGLGVTVVATEVTAYADVPDSIRLVAEATGATEAANALIQDMEGRASAIAEKTASMADEDRPKVYWAVSFGEWGDYTVGPGSFPDDIIRMAGGINVSGNAEYAWPMYTVEQIVIDDPDVIIIPGDETMKESFVTADTYSSLRAVKEGRVYCVDGDIVSRPGPRLTEAVEILFALLYPEA